MLFKPSQKHTNVNIQLLINGQNFDHVKETFFLGVIRDENLNWKSKISHMANKVPKSVGTIIISKSSFKKSL